MISAILLAHRAGDSYALQSMPTAIPKSESALLADFEAHLRDAKLRARRTVSAYVGIAQDLLEDLGVSALSAVGERDVLGYLGRGGAANVRSGRVRWNLELSALRSLFRWATDTGQCSSDVTAAVARQKVAVLEADPLSLGEMVALVDAAREHSPEPNRLRNIALIQVFLHTALRVAEVVALDTDQIDLEARVLHGVRRKGGKVLSAPFNDVVSEALELYLPDRARQHTASAQRALFLSQHGERLSVRTVQQLVSTYAKRAGIARPVTPHTLRHSSATQLAVLGTPMRVIQEICAHSSIVTTERYVHVASRERHEALDRLARAFRAHDRASRGPPEVHGG